VNDRARRPALPQHTLYRPPVAPTYHQRRTVRRQAKQPNRQTPPSCRQQLLEKRPRRTARSTWMAVSAPSARSSWHSLTLPGRDANHDLGLRGCRSTTHPFPTRKPSIGPRSSPRCAWQNIRGTGNRLSGMMTTPLIWPASAADRRDLPPIEGALSGRPAGIPQTNLPVIPGASDDDRPWPLRRP
jgi:hypothetical protein